MYIDKNKGLSFVEIIIAVTILLIVSFVSLITFYSMNKSFSVMNSAYKREKEIMTFRDLVASHIKWNESTEKSLVKKKEIYW